MQLSGPFTAVQPGEVVGGRYRVGELLGRGGMAEVYDGVDERLERKVAIKLLRPEMAAREDVRTRFRAEARAAAGLSHPNAVAVFDTGEHDGVPYLIMERLPGDTLADRIAEGPVDPVWLRRAAVGLLGALAAAHEAGIVHRDVKPGNILLTRDGTAKITDFGIAKSLHPADAPGGRHRDLTATGQLLGTPNYLAPERLEGEPATPRSDLWAFGAVLYEALSGTKPFQGRSSLEVAQAVVNGKHRFLGELRPDVDPAFVATIERALNRDPAARFVSAAEMAGALEEVAQTRVDSGTMVLPASALRPTRRRARGAGAPLWARLRRPNRLSGRNALLLGLLALLVILVGLSLGRGDDLDTPLATERQGRTATTQPTPATTATTAAPAPAPTNANQALAQRLRDLAGRLDPAQHGARTAELAAGLRQVAASLEAGAAATAGQATAALMVTAAWYQTGQLTDQAAAAALDLLRQVPGVSTQLAPGSSTGSGSAVVTGGTENRSGSTSGTSGSTSGSTGSARTDSDKDDDKGESKGKGKDD